MNCTGKNCIMQYDKVDPATCPCVPYCPQATPPKTKTDIIRQMTDEQLALIFYFATQESENSKLSIDQWLEWLKEEVKDG